MLQCSKIDPPSSFSQPPAAAAGKSSENISIWKAAGCDRCGNTINCIKDLCLVLMVKGNWGAVCAWNVITVNVTATPSLPSFIISLIFLSCLIWQGYYKHKYIRKYSLSLCPLVSFLNIFLINNRWRSLALKVLLAVTSQQRIIWYSSLSSASFMSPLCLWLSVSQPNFQHAAVLSKNKKLHCRHQVH